jgi:hypothetical protein
MTIQSHLFLGLLAAHVLSDFVLQTDRIVEQKHRLPVLARHALTVTLLSYLLAGNWAAWPIALIVGLSHFLIDRIKTFSRQSRMLVFSADQFAHVLVILMAAWAWPQLNAGEGAWTTHFGSLYARAMIFLTGLIITTHVGGVLVGMQVRPYLDDLTRSRADAGQRVIDPAKETQRGLARGGRTIGRLERTLIFFLVMIGKPEGTAFLVAAKSIFRFGELKDRENRAEAEYITIGTLMSFTWGLAASWITWQICRSF